MLSPDKHLRSERGQIDRSFELEDQATSSRSSFMQVSKTVQQWQREYNQQRVGYENKNAVMMNSHIALKTLYPAAEANSSHRTHSRPQCNEKYI